MGYHKHIGKKYILGGHILKKKNISKTRALEEGVRDSRFKPLNGPEIQDSNRPGFGIQISFEPYTEVRCYQVGIQI